MSLQNNDVRSELATLIESGAVSQAQVARECGISAALVSQFLNDKYTGDNDKVARDLAAFIVRFKAASDQPVKNLPFVPTSVYKAVTEVAQTCHASGIIGLVVGASGLGKTRSIEEYAANNPGVILIRAHAKYSVKDVFSDIHIEVGFDGKGNVHRMMRDIEVKLKGTKRLIVIDEAEHLTANTLDEIRQINDRVGVGILYIGLEKFRSQLRTMRTGFEYIVNRVRIPRKLEKLQLADVEKLVSTVLPNANGLCKVFHEMSGGNARVLETILFNSFRVSSIKKCEINAELIKQVALAVIV